MGKMKTTLLATSLTAAAFIAFGAAPTASAFSMQGGVQGGIDAARGEGQPTTLFGDAGIITSVTNILLFFAGALSVIMIIWGGLRYVTSAGNSSSVTAAKNTIMYAIIGLIIAFLAFAAVNWILGAVAGTVGGGAGYTDV